MNYIKWPNDYNRPLSPEELSIKFRLQNAPPEGLGDWQPKKEEETK